jgi:hypothetical protein
MITRRLTALMEGLLVRARVEVRQQRWSKAHSSLESAMTLSRTMPLPYAEAKALYIYGLLHTARGEVEPARKRLVAAVTILHRLGERLYIEHVEQTLSGLVGQ